MTVQLTTLQAAKKKLESRRLGFDTSQAKLQKAKKDDFRLEEELRSQKAKYEESSEDVYRRMLDIKEAEVDSIADLTSFIDAELNYYDRAREILLQLKHFLVSQSMIEKDSEKAAPDFISQRAETRSSFLFL